MRLSGWTASVRPCVWPMSMPALRSRRRLPDRNKRRCQMATGLVDKIYGCLLGGLIGDAMGAPGEGKTFEQIQEQFGEDGITDFEGVGTDDTAIREQLIHAILTNNGYVTCD